jgi:hypothetical protein
MLRLLQLYNTIVQLLYLCNVIVDKLSGHEIQWACSDQGDQMSL